MSVISSIALLVVCVALLLAHFADIKKTHKN
jgi:hypothetical protein